MNIQQNDLIGKKFGGWTVLEKTKKKTQGNTYYYLIKCDCGKQRLAVKSEFAINTKKCKSCTSKEFMKTRNYNYEKKVMGTTINGWNIYDVKKENKYKRYFGKCKCGNIKIKSISEFKRHVCKKCSMKSPGHSKRCMDNAKSLIGSTKGNFRILGVIGLENNHIVLKCKCLNCKKVSNIRNGLLNSRKTCSHCRYSTKPKGSNNHMTTLKEIEVISMRELFKSGLYSPKALAEMYRTNIFNIYSILSRKSWKYV